MTPDEFRVAGHELIDWIADHRESVELRPVRPPVAPGDIIGALPESATTPAEPHAAVLADLGDIVAAGITDVQHPMHFGWFPSNASYSSILGDIASSGLAALGISWESAPALTEVEEVVVDWMRQLCGLSDNWKGVIQEAASTTCLVAMLAARERATGHAQAGGGVLGFGKRLAVYSTAEAHSSVRKGALLAGFAADDLRLIDHDPWTRDMLPGALAAAIADDMANDIIPAAVVATVGTTATTAFDPLRQIGEICNEHNAWLHVDGAMAGAAMILPEHRHLFDGIELADSITWNPHKWFGTILDCSLMYLRDPDHLVRVMSTNPSYLRTTVEGELEPTQYRDWGIPLSRRFRALKLWYQLRLDDIDELRARLREDIANAQWLANEIESLDGWSVCAPVRMQTVTIRHEPDGLSPDQVSAHNHDWVRRVNASGAAFLTPSMLDGQWMVRVSIGAEPTKRHHLGCLIELIRKAAAESLADRGVIDLRDPAVAVAERA